MKRYLVLVSLALIALTGFARGIDMVTLLTDEEGRMGEKPNGLVNVGRLPDTGPVVKVVAPDLSKEYQPPVKIDVRFIPKGNSRVDLSKFSVECLKIIDIDITDRIMPYVTEQGVKVDNAKLPSGEHKLKVTIGDNQGGITQVIFMVKVN